MYRIIDTDWQKTAREYGIGELSARLIACAGLSAEQVEELMDQTIDVRTSQAECVKKCAERLRMAAENHEKVFVGGDYDADGICSTAIMKHCLDRLGIVNGYYIPDRFKEGYGLSPHTVELAAAKGYTLILTVDNGVKAHEAIRKAHELGVEIIITDHHVIEEPIDAPLVVHPDYMEEEYRYLSGAGVALQISRTLIGEDDLSTSLAATAAIGDVMPLWKQTRMIVRYGLAKLRQRFPYPLSVLMYPGAPADASTVAFQIVPKLNSLGRMNDISNVNTLIPYLLSQNTDVINRYAGQINTVNTRRKELAEQQTQLAMELCTDERILLIRDDRFHEGICGPVAGRLADELRKPAVVFARSGGMLKGSGRSAGEFDLFRFFSRFPQLTSFGGHAKAVGLSLPVSEYEAFRAEVLRAYEEEGDMPAETEKPAVIISADAVHLQNLYDLSAFDPLPAELRDIAFALPFAGAKEVYRSDKVIRYALANRTGGMEAVLYTRKNIQIPDHPQWLIGSLTISRYRNQVTPQMIIDAIQ